MDGPDEEELEAHREVRAVRKKSGSLNILRWLVCLIVAGALVIGVMMLLPEASKAQQADDPSLVHVRMGVADLHLPVPAGLMRADTSAPALREILQVMAGEGRILAFFITPEDAARLRAQEAPQMARYAVIGAMPSLEYERMRRDDFAYFRQVMHERYDALAAQAKAQGQVMMDEATDALKEDYDIASKIDLGDVVFLGVFLDREDVIAHHAVAKYEMSVIEESEAFTIINAGASVPVKGKLLTLGLYQDYTAQSDIADVKTRLRNWVDAIRLHYPVEEAFVPF